jgi:transcriptional/translational regulatory protein YebC/TACO1
LLECMADNRNRTVADVRHAFNKRGGNLGSDCTVAYLFSRLSQLYFAPGLDEGAVMEAALDAGAEDLQFANDGAIGVLTAFVDSMVVKEATMVAGFASDHAEIIMQPSLTMALNVDSAESLSALIEMLEDLDDVQNVHSNAEIPNEVLAALAE